MSTDTSVDITITFAPGIINGLVMSETEYGCNALEKLLKLYTTRTTTNMHMFDEKEKLRKFASAKDIIDYYIGVRLDTYVSRKKHQLGCPNEGRYGACLTRRGSSAQYLMAHLT